MSLLQIPNPVSSEAAGHISSLNDPAIELLAYIAFSLVIALSGAVVHMFISLRKNTREYAEDLKKIETTHKNELENLNTKYSLELKAERDYSKQQDRENIKLFNNISNVIQNLSRGIDVELPNKLKVIGDQVVNRVEMIKVHIESKI